MMKPEEFYDRMRDFLVGLQEEAGSPCTQPIGVDDNLFDLGLVTSFTMIRMIVFVEELTGVTVDLTNHDLETFYTLRGLHTVVRNDEVAL